MKIKKIKCRITCGAYGEKCKYPWDSAAEDLIPTRTSPCGDIVLYFYCGKKAFPIQAGLRNSKNEGVPYIDRDFSVTDYTCICKGAREELKTNKS